MTRDYRKRTIRLAIVVGAIAALTACINPFSSNSSGGGGGSEAAAGNGGGTQFGSLVINPPGGVGASTVAPNLDLKAAVSTYNVTLTNVSPGGITPITVNGYIEGVAINDIPTGTWDLSLQGLNASSQPIATGTPTSGNPITVSSGGTTGITIELAPMQAADGELDVTLNWGAALAPGIDVDQVSVTLALFGTPQSETLTITESGPTFLSFTDHSVTSSGTVDVNFDSRTVTVFDASLNSGFYILTMQLYEGTGAGAVEYAPVIEAVQIYDYLRSTASINLGPGDLTNAPDAPTNLTATLTGDNAFALSWTDASNTEEGFNIYQGTIGASPTTSRNAGIEAISSTDPALGYTGDAGDEIMYYVTAYNDFGESAAVTVTFTPIGESGVTFAGGTHTNHPSWAAAGDPGDLTWSAFPGADSYVVHVSSLQSDVITLSSPVDTVTGAAFDLATAGPFSPETEYYWRIEAQNAGTTGSVASSMESFTVRDGLFVAKGGSDGAQGSISSPVLTITAAIDLAESGETIHVDDGMYDEQLIIDKSLRIEGASGPPTTIRHTQGSGFIAETIRQTAGDLELRDIDILGPEFSGSEPDRQIGIWVEGAAQSLSLDSVNIYTTQGEIMAGVNLETDAAFSMRHGSVAAISDGAPNDEFYGVLAIDHTRNNDIVIDGAAFTIPDGSHLRRAVAVDSTPGTGSLLVTEFSVFNLGVATHAGGADRSFAISSSIPTTVQNSIIRMGASDGYLSAIRVPEESLIENNRIEIVDVGSGTDESHVVLIDGSGDSRVYNNIMAVRPSSGGSFDFVQTNVATEVVHNTMVAYRATADWKGVERIGGDFIIMRNNIVQSFSPEFGQGFYTSVAGGTEVVGNVFYRNNSFRVAGATYSNVFVFNTTTPGSITQNVETAPMLYSGEDLLGDPFEWLRTLSVAGNSVVTVGDSWGGAPQDITGDPRSAPATAGAYELPAGDGVVGLVGEWLSVQSNPGFDSSGTEGIATNGLALRHILGILTDNGRYGRPGAFGWGGRGVSLESETTPVAFTYPELATADGSGFTISAWFMIPPERPFQGIIYSHRRTGGDGVAVRLDSSSILSFEINGASSGLIINPGLEYEVWYQLFVVFENSRVTVYVLDEDGTSRSESIATVSVPIGTLAASDNRIRWGERTDGTDRFEGLLDDMRYFNVALPSTAIEAMQEHQY